MSSSLVLLSKNPSYYFSCAGCVHRSVRRTACLFIQGAKDRQKGETPNLKNKELLL